MEDQKTYIAGLGVACGLGVTLETVACAVDAGIDCFDNSPYVNKAFEPVRMALLPQKALPELNDNIPFSGQYSRWHKHLLQLSHLAIEEALLAAEKESPIPLILALPEHLDPYPHQIPSHFIQHLAIQCGIDFCSDLSRTLQIGRAGVFAAISLASRILEETDCTQVLVGGVDSYQRPNLLHGMLEEGRVNGPGVLDGFTPGEGAGFLLLTRQDNIVFGDSNYLLRVGAVAEAQELGHMYSDEPYRGEGLAQAFSLALSAHNGPPIKSVYSSMNGEHFWAKELGVGLTRSAKYLGEQSPEIEHPADCWGDLGAASGAVIAALAAHRLLKQSAEGAHLLNSSSDQAPRSAMTLYTESYKLQEASA